MATYTVQKGDSLSLITKRFTGSFKQWRNLYNLNSAKIKDPNKIYPGQVLTLPDSWSAIPGKGTTTPDIPPKKQDEAAKIEKGGSILPVIIGAGVLYWLS